MFSEKEYIEQPKYEFDFYHFIFAILFLVLGSVYFNLVITWYAPYKVTIFTFMFLLIGGAYVYLRRAFNKMNLFLLGASVVLSLAAFTKTMSEETELLWFLVLHLSALLFALSSYDESFSSDFLCSVAKSVFFPFKSFLSLPLALFAPLGSIKESVAHKRKNIMLVAMGVVVSIPIVLLVGSLLLSDMFFNSFAGALADMIASFFSGFNIARYVNPVTLFASFYLFAAFYNGEKRKEETKAYNAIPFVISQTVLSILIFFYGIFFFSQLLGVIKCIGGTLPAGETYSSFARSGFFNLCIVACINGLVMYFANKKTANKLIKALSVILSFATILIIGTAFSKMLLYISAYGFTPKRFYTIWFMLLLTITFVLSVIKLKKESFKLSQTMIYITYAMLVILFFVNFEGLSVYLNS